MYIKIVLSVRSGPFHFPTKVFSLSHSTFLITIPLMLKMAYGEGGLDRIVFIWRRNLIISKWIFKRSNIIKCSRLDFFQWHQSATIVLSVSIFQVLEQSPPNSHCLITLGSALPVLPVIGRQNQIFNKTEPSRGGGLACSYF